MTPGFQGCARLLLPPRISDRELYACVDAGVFIAEGSAGNMYRVGSDIERAAWLEEVMDSDTELWGEVPDTGVCVGAIVEDVVGWPSEGRVFVVGPDEASTTLSPGNDLTVAGTGEVPLEQDGGDGDAGEGSAYGVGRGAVSGGG